MSIDNFWAIARRRLVFWLETTVRLAGHKVTHKSMLQALQDFSLAVNRGESPKGYFFSVCESIDLQIIAHELARDDVQLSGAAKRFWNEFSALAEVTRTPIIFDVMARLEHVAYGCETPQGISALDMGYFE